MNISFSPLVWPFQRCVPFARRATQPSKRTCWAKPGLRDYNFLSWSRVFFYRNSNRNLLFLITFSDSKWIFSLFYEQFDWEFSKITFASKEAIRSKQFDFNDRHTQSRHYHIFHCLLLNALRIVKRIIFDKRFEWILRRRKSRRRRWVKNTLVRFITFGNFTTIFVVVVVWIIKKPFFHFKREDLR